MEKWEGGVTLKKWRKSKKKKIKDKNGNNNKKMGKKSKDDIQDLNSKQKEMQLVRFKFQQKASNKGLVSDTEPQYSTGIYSMNPERMKGLNFGED